MLRCSSSCSASHCHRFTKFFVVLTNMLHYAVYSFFGMFTIHASCFCVKFFSSVCSLLSFNTIATNFITTRVGFIFTKLSVTPVSGKYSDECLSDSPSFRIYRSQRSHQKRVSCNGVRNFSTDRSQQPSQ